MKNIDEVFINGVSSDEFFPLVGECVSDCDNEAVLSQEEEIVSVLPLRNMVLFPGSSCCSENFPTPGLSFSMPAPPPKPASQSLIS